MTGIVLPKVQPKPVDYDRLWPIMAFRREEQRLSSHRKVLMSSPCELILVWCPCGALYRDSWRPSINLSLDDFDDEYIQRMSSTTCPNCGLSTRMGTLLARFENDHLRLEYRLVPEPLPVILYLAERARDQSQTLYRIREWLAQHGTSGVAKIQEILSQKGDSEPDTYGIYEELSEILFEWRFMDEFPDQGRTKAHSGVY